MKDKITVIITIRNREASRIENQVNSIRKHGANPTIHVVDYGSDEKYRKQYEEICSKLEIQYTHMYAEGLPWNKCRAINYGAKQSTTPFIVTSDVDMIYTSNPFQWCLDNYEDKTIYHIPTYWLPKNGNEKKARYAGVGNSGGFLFSSKEAFEDIGGYDEGFLYWGPEDVDFPNRLKQIGYKQIWLPNDFHKLFHVWHKSLSSKYSKPFLTEYLSNQLYLENCFCPKSNQDFGKNITYEMRPILKFIQKNDFECINFDVGNLGKPQNLNKLRELAEKKGCYRLNLQSRLKKRPLDKFRDFIPKLLKPITSLTGTKIEFNENKNFDFIFIYITSLLKFGLVDYYISTDFSFVYLLW